MMTHAPSAAPDSMTAWALITLPGPTAALGETEAVEWTAEVSSKPAE